MSDDVLSIILRARDETGSVLKKTHTDLLSVAGAVAVGTAAYNALGVGVSSVVGFLSDSVKAAMDEETSQAKLKSALDANVKGWDGNSAAIEEVLKARMKLGFSDEAQRDSLAVLVARTGDVTAALDIQRAAMDLARLKGIDLAAASKAIALGMSGSGKALKELGINVKDFASGAEIMGAIQAKAAGQAEAYANTTAGSMEGMQLQIEEASKVIGERLLPVIKEMAFFIRDNAVPAVTSLADSFDSLVKNTGKEVDTIANAPRDFWDWLFHGNEPLYGRQVRDATEGLVGWTASIAEGGSKAVIAANQSENLAAATRASATAARDAKADEASYNESLARTAEWTKYATDVLPALATAFRTTAAAARVSRLDAAYGLAELPLQIEAATAAVKAAAIVVKANPLDPQAKIDLLEAQKNLDEWNAKLRAEGPNAVIIGRELGDQLGSGLYQKVMDWNALTRAQLLNLGQVTLTPARPTGNRNIDAPARAVGGPVTGGQPYVVGEKGPELFIPGQSGGIAPNGGLGSTVNFGSGSIIVNGASDPAATAQALMLEIKRQLTRQGTSFSGGY